MKVAGKLQVLREPTTSVEIDPSIVTAAKLQAHTTLDAVVLLPQKRPQGLPSPKFTVIGTTLQTDSWANIVRVSLTLDPRPGALRELVSALTEIHLYCRYVETINDVDLRHMTAIAPDQRSYPLKKGADLIIPSTLIVIEVPPTLPSTTISPLGQNIHRELRRLIRNGLTRKEDDRNTARNLIQKYLEDYFNRAPNKEPSSLEVDWVSPMTTLNRLAHRLRSRTSLPHLRLSQQLLISAPQSDSLSIDLSNLRHVLWDKSKPTLLSSLIRSRSSLFVKAFSDSDEKILCWDFYTFDNDLVVQFGLTTSNARSEYLWWEWTFRCIEEAGGNILASANWARIDGGWTTLQTTVVFPLRENVRPHAATDIRNIVECFRKLQGDKGYTEHFEEMSKPLQAACAIDGSSISNPPRSILQNLEVWDPAGQDPTHSRSFTELFAPNPFNFTNPLDLAGYRDLYGDDTPAPPRGSSRGTSNESDEITRSRRQLALRIIEKLFSNPGENIAIVGAHRAGKTTVLNLVYDMVLNDSFTAHAAVTVVPIRINASVDPPDYFLASVTRELKSLKDASVENKELPKSVRNAAETILNSLSELELDLSPILNQVGVEIPIALNLSLITRQLDKLIKRRKSSQDSAAKDQHVDVVDDSISILSGTENNSPATTAAFLRISLDHFRKALNKTSPGSQRILIIVDEFSESSAWGSDKALPLWRHVIESREFSNVKWLLSTSRPIKEASTYSPITNVLHEFNVGPLPREEGERLIDAFSVRAWRSSPLAKASKATPEEQLRPVIMAQARLFLLEITSRLPYLLQVVCYHVYDRAIRTYVPLISRNLCINIVCDYVLPELSDYLDYQWSQIREDARAQVRESLPQLDQKEFLRNLDKWTNNDVHDLSQGIRKALERSGLQGDDSRFVAPIVACWLLAPSRTNHK